MVSCTRKGKKKCSLYFVVFKDSPAAQIAVCALNSSLTKNYFLTHFHPDHYGGITKQWNAGIIYCSLETANLVHQQLGVDRKYLHPLGMMMPTIIESSGKPVSVTLLDANHCPGAVMFLFEVGKRRVLHVGDFRWNRDLMMKCAPLRAFSMLQVRLDDLLLDTTYCDEKYTLPTQAEAIRATIEIAEKEWELSKRRGQRALLLFGAYTIGKERIYLSVAERLQLKVYVDKRRYRILSALNWSKECMSILTTNPEASCLWVVPLGHINFKNMQSYLGGMSDKPFSKKMYDRVVGFRPTGWSMSANSDGIVSTQTKGSITVHGVPYSEHSSFTELVDCLECLKPKRIIPTVSVSKSAEQVDLLLRKVKEKQGH
jgi:DNA cross-link repair 1A protein